MRATFIVGVVGLVLTSGCKAFPPTASVEVGSPGPCRLAPDRTIIAESGLRC
jgi:hypothetical protein